MNSSTIHPINNINDPTCTQDQSTPNFGNFLIFTITFIDSPLPPPIGAIHASCAASRDRMHDLHAFAFSLRRRGHTTKISCHQPYARSLLLLSSSSTPTPTPTPTPPSRRAPCAVRASLQDDVAPLLGVGWLRIPFPHHRRELRVVDPPVLHVCITHFDEQERTYGSIHRSAAKDA